MAIVKIDDKLKTVDIENLQVGKYYRWCSRIEGCDWSDINNYNNICCYAVGQFIGIIDETPIFKSDDDEFEKAINICTSNYPRYIYDALEAYDLIVDTLYE